MIALCSSKIWFNEAIFLPRSRGKTQWRNILPRVPTKYVVHLTNRNLRHIFCLSKLWWKCEVIHIFPHFYCPQRSKPWIVNQDLCASLQSWGEGESAILWLVIVRDQKFNKMIRSNEIFKKCIFKVAKVVESKK